MTDIKRRHRSTPQRKHSYEVRVGACADYLIGLPVKVIEHKWGLPICSVQNWIRKTGQFKLRNRRA